MYENLKQAMKERKIRIGTIADLLNVTYLTARNKLTGRTRFYLDEAQKVAGLFPDKTLGELFRH